MSDGQCGKVIVTVNNPRSIPAETSIDKGGYYLVYSFEAQPSTTCTDEDEQPLNVKDVLKDARYGRVECRVPKTVTASATVRPKTTRVAPMTTASPRLTQSLFQEDRSVLAFTTVAAGLLSMVALAIGRS